MTASLVGVFTLPRIFGGLSNGVRELLQANAGSAFGDLSGMFLGVMIGAVLLWLGGLTGFALVHAWGRRFRFSVGLSLIALGFVTLYSLWVVSVPLLEFAGRRFWLATGGLLLIWDVGLMLLGAWMVKTSD